MPEHVKPISSFGMPQSSITSWTTGMRISTSLRVALAPDVLGDGDGDDRDVTHHASSVGPGRKCAIDSVVGPHSAFGFHTASTRMPMWIWSYGISWIRW